MLYSHVHIYIYIYIYKDGCLLLAGRPGWVFFAVGPSDCPRARPPASPAYLLLSDIGIFRYLTILGGTVMIYIFSNNRRYCQIFSNNRRYPLVMYDRRYCHDIYFLIGVVSRLSLSVYEFHMKL